MTAGFGDGPGARGRADHPDHPDFLALPNPDPDHNEQAGGFLRLAAEKAFLSIVDPHLAASRVSAAADSVVGGELRCAAGAGHPGAEPGAAGPDQDLPSTGPSARPSWRTQLQDNLNAGGPPVVLFAEDMTIGQRFDVLDQGVWRSLFERRQRRWVRLPAAPRAGA